MIVALFFKTWARTIIRVLRLKIFELNLFINAGAVVEESVKNGGENKGKEGGSGY